MPNHYHLVIDFKETPEISLSKTIGAIQQVYANKYHRRHNTAGKLFQNRFKSQAIDKETYLLACGRYVEQNPVRAGMCKLPWDWEWSSAKYYIGGISDGITVNNPLFKDRQSYKDFLIKESTEEGLFKSDKDFIGPAGFAQQIFKVDGRMKCRRVGTRPGHNKQKPVTT